MSLLFVGSSSDLSLKTIKKLGVEYINYPYKKDDLLHYYDENFDFDGFYSKCKKGCNFANANMSRDDYLKIFEHCFEMGDDVLFVHSSENIIDISSLLECQQILKEKFPERKLQLIDSKNISVGEGLVAYLCAMLYRKGEDLSSIAEKSIDIVRGSAFFFVSNNSNTLEKNNIISSNFTTGTSLNIRPIWKVNFDGKIELFEKVSGKKKCVSRLLEIMRQTGENVIDFPIEIVYTIDKSSAQSLKEKIIETYGTDANVNIERMTPNNTLLLGEDILGISFHTHKKVN